MLLRALALTSLLPVALASTLVAQPGGVQWSPDGARILVSKDVGAERWAMALGAGLNADYYFDLELFEIVLELKQLSTYRASHTIDQYFSQCFSEGTCRVPFAARSS